MKKHIVITLAISGILGIALPLSGSNKEDTFNNRLLSIPAKNIKSYEFNSSIPLLKRIQPAPIFLMNYLKSVDKREDYTSYTPSEKEYILIRNYLSKLPPLHKRILKERLRRHMASQKRKMISV